MPLSPCRILVPYYVFNYAVVKRHHCRQEVLSGPIPSNSEHQQRCEMVMRHSLVSLLTKVLFQRMALPLSHFVYTEHFD